MTNTTAHTPGPWQVSENHGELTLTGHTRIFVPGGTGIAVYSMGDPIETIQAYARLIAAAPEMLAALQMALITLEDEYPPEVFSDYPVFGKVRAAIAKAEGK